MRAGELRHIISIQEESPTPDGMGGENLTWAAVSGMDSVPAAIWPLRSNERLDMMKLENEVTHKIRIRYRSGITTKNRVLFGPRTFNIVSLINPDERNIMLEILAVEES